MNLACDRPIGYRPKGKRKSTGQQVSHYELPSRRENQITNVILLVIREVEGRSSIVESA